MSSEEIPPAEMGAVGAGEGAEGAGVNGAGADGSTLDLTDPKAMRALAHPVRMALLELFTVAATLTATQASEALGESPANCAFHLRTLGKYGFIAEAGGGKGRERPWKIVNTTINLSVNHDDADTALSARTLQQVWLDRVMKRARQILSNTDELPDGWLGAQEASQSVTYMTADELRELSKEVHSLLTTHKGRREDPAMRPAGALPVETVFFAYPLAELAELSREM